MKINWKTRIKHPVFWIGILSAIAAPVMAYFGGSPADLTTWESLFDVVIGILTNPWLLFSVIMAALNFLGIATDHTTAGLSDSKQARTYKKPREDKYGI